MPDSMQERHSSAMINDKYNALGFVPGLGPAKLPTEQPSGDAASFQQAIGRPAPVAASEAPRQPLVAGAPMSGTQSLVGASAASGPPSASGFAAWFERPDKQRLVDDEHRGSFA